MSDTKDTDRPANAGRKPLTLKRNEGAGTVRQSFSHNRTKTVVVEKKRRRVLTQGKDGVELTADQRAAKALGLSEEEVRRRQQAIEAAKAQESERRAQKEAEEAARRNREEADRQRLESERRRVEQEAREREIAAERAAAVALAIETGVELRETPAVASPEPVPTEAAPVEARSREAGAPARGETPHRKVKEPETLDTLDELGGRVKKSKGGGGPGAIAAAKPAPRAKGEPERRRGKITIQSALNEGDNDRQRSIAALRRAREREKQRRMVNVGEREKQRREVVIPEVITVGDLANRMAERAADVIKYLMKQGQMVRANDLIDPDIAELIVVEFGHDVKRVAESDVEDGFLSAEDKAEDVESRPPVVTVMGHVDHGKTSLLDALRSTDVASGEAGGITQHIGAYQVQVSTGERITFLDTPGHAAFSAMRARGATATDIVILVVAADDGVMPQTIEAINHAKAAGAPIIVAVNKMDKPGASSQKVVTELLQHEIVAESLGGETQIIEVSALKRMGLETLTEAISLQAEVLELKANANRSAEGVVIESQIDRGRGSVATVLVKRGTLRRGEIVVAGTAWGKVRALIDERERQLDSAGPSTPVEILGLDQPPEPGEPFAVVENEARARELTDFRQRKKRDRIGVGPSAAASLEQMMSRLKDRQVQEMGLVVKADVQGSAEAIAQALEKLGNDEVKARALHTAVGGINESDVLLAKASGSPIIAFNVRANKQARDLAEREGVEIRYYSIIYNLLDDVRAVLQGMLAPEKREEFIGYAEILEVFSITKVGKVAGCRISEGVVRRGCGVRLLRDDVVVHEGKLSTLKRFKDEVPEVYAGLECGMAFENYQDIQAGDRIECFTVTEVQRTLS